MKTEKSSDLELSLSVDRTDIWPTGLVDSKGRPVLPRFSGPKPTNSTVTARLLDVRTGAPLSQRTVHFDMASATARGHDHSGQPAFTAQCNTDDGACFIPFATEVSGVYTIRGHLSEDPSVNAVSPRINVKIDGLKAAGASPFYVLTGQYDALRCDGRSKVTSRHRENHFADHLLLLEIALIGESFKFWTGTTMRVNDMSLEWGGLFDVQNNWSPPHSQHRVGIHADIEFNGWWL